MKKSIVVATSLSTAVLMLAGCTQPTTSAEIAEKLNKNLNVLGSTVKKMDTIDNEYIANQDLMIEDNQVQVSAPPKQYEVQYLAMNTIPHTYSRISNANMMTKQPYAVKLSNTKKVLEECIDGDCIEEKADMYTSTTGGRCFTEEYTYDCGEMDTQEILKKLLEKKLIESLDGTDCTSTEDGGYCVTRTSTNTEDNTITIHKMQYTPASKTEDNNAMTLNSEVPTHLSGYVQRVQKLYQMTNNVLNANNTLDDCRNNILECIDELKELTNSLKDNNNVTMQQIQALNNYVYDIKTSIARIKNCNGQLSNEISNISHSNQYGVAKSIDVMNSNYMRILNHLDVRITYLRNVIATLDQVRYIILETMIDDTVEVPEVSDTEEVESDTLEENTQEEIPSEDDTEIDKEDPNASQNVVIEEAQDDTAEETQDTIDNDSNIDKESGMTLPNPDITSDIDNTGTNNANPDTQIIEDSTTQNNMDINQNDVSEDTMTEEITNDNTENIEKVIDSSSNMDNTQNQYNNDNNYTIITNDIIDNDNNDIDNDNNTNINNNENNDENTNKNENNETPDAKKETKTIKNIDTYQDNLYDNLDLDEVIKNKQQDTSSVGQDTNTNTQKENTTNHENTVNSTNNNTVNSTPNTVDNTAQNNNTNSIVSGTNSLGYEIGQNHNDINTPNGAFENTVIGQNNLGNGIPGKGATGLNGNNDKNHKNINTYGYNTIVDMVNRGTVNNGINTL